MSDDNFLIRSNLIDPMRHMNREIEQQRSAMIRAAAEVAEKKERYEQNVLTALKGIERNTANLAQIVTIIQTNNEKQDEIIALITEILSIGKSKDKEEVDSKYKQVIKKITDFSGNVESIQGLLGTAQTVYNTVSGMF